MRFTRMLVAACACTCSCATAEAGDAPLHSTSPGLKVAFIGDAGSPDDDPRTQPEAVLRLVRDEGADLILHQGDLGYIPDPTAWIEMVDGILGPDFPYFFSIGNHDGGGWTEFYRPWLERKIRRLEEIRGEKICTCTTDLGEGVSPHGVGLRAACEFEGLFFVLSDLGFWPDGSNDPFLQQIRAQSMRFLRDELSYSSALWRVVSWHASQVPFTVAPSVSLEVGIETYTHCLDAGAIVATGHSHSYSRTRTLTSFDPPAFDPGRPTDDLHVREGSTFAFVSGLGGIGRHRQTRCQEPVDPPNGACEIWGSISTEQFGALFVEFHVDDDPRRARGYFKDIDGRTIDTFTLTNGVASEPRPRPPSFVRGAINEHIEVSSNRLGGADAICLLDFLFSHQSCAEILCHDAADVNDDGALGISDAVWLLSWLYLGQPGPPPPSTRGTTRFSREDCCSDATEDELGCEEFSKCAN